MDNSLGYALPMDERNPLNYPFGDLPKPFHEELAKFLDTPLGANWEMLADRLGCVPVYTRWIKNRVINFAHGSPTLVFFSEFCQELKVGQILYALHSIGNLACIDVLQQYLLHQPLSGYRPAVVGPRVISSLGSSREACVNSESLRSTGPTSLPPRNMIYHSDSEQMQMMYHSHSEQMEPFGQKLMAAMPPPPQDNNIRYDHLVHCTKQERPTQDGPFASNQSYHEYDCYPHRQPVLNSTGCLVKKEECSDTDREQEVEDQDLWRRVENIGKSDPSTHRQPDDRGDGQLAGRGASEEPQNLISMTSRTRDINVNNEDSEGFGSMTENVNESIDFRSAEFEDERREQSMYVYPGNFLRGTVQESPLRFCDGLTRTAYNLPSLGAMPSVASDNWERRSTTTDGSIDLRKIAQKQEENFVLCTAAKTYFSGGGFTSGYSMPVYVNLLPPSSGHPSRLTTAYARDEGFTSISPRPRATETHVTIVPSARNRCANEAQADKVSTTAQQCLVDAFNRKKQVKKSPNGYVLPQQQLVVPAESRFGNNGSIPPTEVRQHEFSDKENGEMFDRFKMTEGPGLALQALHQEGARAEHGKLLNTTPTNQLRGKPAPDKIERGKRYTDPISKADLVERKAGDRPMRVKTESDKTEEGKKRYTDPLSTADKKILLEQPFVTASDVKVQAEKSKSSALSVLETAPFKRDGRKVRVFVTYSVDSKKHMKAVMNICRCLKENEFSVSLDAREAALLAHDRIGWYEERLNTADYVLVLISPQYFRDVTVTEKNSAAVTSAPLDSSLNTLYIHRWMQTEVWKNKCVNRRFIPVLMPDGATRDHIPNWLQNTTVYSWPQHYQNLFFYMLHPQGPQQVVREYIRGDKSPNNEESSIKGSPINGSPIKGGPIKGSPISGSPKNRGTTIQNQPNNEFRAKDTLIVCRN